MNFKVLIDFLISIYYFCYSRIRIASLDSFLIVKCNSLSAIDSRAQSVTGLALSSYQLNKSQKHKEKEMTLINMSSPSSIYDIFSVKGISLLY